MLTAHSMSAEYLRPTLSEIPDSRYWAVIVNNVIYLIWTISINWIKIKSIKHTFKSNGANSS